jgi:hypothetical protein
MRFRPQALSFLLSFAFIAAFAIATAQPSAAQQPSGSLYMTRRWDYLRPLPSECRAASRVRTSPSSARAKNVMLSASF